MAEPDLSGVRVLLTGGAGFVGSHVVDQLVARGAEVVALLRPSYGGVPQNLAHVAPSIRMIPVDLSDEEATAAALQTARTLREIHR